MARARLALPIAALLALPLGACLGGGGRTPPVLMTLSADVAPDAGPVRSTASAPVVAIALPSAPQEIAVARVPVHSGDTSITYVKDAVWIEPPARQFLRLLQDRVGARTGRVVVARRAGHDAPGTDLSGELRAFGMDAGAKEAVVVYEAMLSRATGGVIERRRFEAREPVGRIDATSVGPALNRAANRVAGEVADWIATAR